jgi:hypothetical protein
MRAKVNELLYQKGIQSALMLHFQISLLKSVQTGSPMFAIQYLEYLPNASLEEMRSKLQMGLEILPFSQLIVGWNLPASIVAMCCEECRKAQVEIYRWQPLLCADGEFFPKSEWSMQGADGKKVRGFKDMPEFTFTCPNNPSAQKAILMRLKEVMWSGPYDGVFLDRMRYPSPLSDPENEIGCFCDHCYQKAKSVDLDLDEVRKSIENLCSKKGGVNCFVQDLFNPGKCETDNSDRVGVKRFLRFRIQSISDCIKKASRLVHGLGFKVGLDCFSPNLTSPVGQDLSELQPHAEWTKIMSYAHALGPAGIPFELINLLSWLKHRKQFSEKEALTSVSQAVNLKLPETFADFRNQGLSPGELAKEVGKTSLHDKPVLAGIELVDKVGITNLNSQQIRHDLEALSHSEVTGLALSWDLWSIPLERLHLVEAIWKDKID